MQVRRSDVKSAWSGIRPLASDPNASDTASASRDHVVTMDEDGMITVTGARLRCAAVYRPCRLEHICSCTAQMDGWRRWSCQVEEASA